MEIISRARWGARHDRGFDDAPLPASEVWLHHTVTIAPDLLWIDANKDGVDDDEKRAMLHLEQIGEDRFGGGISYTFLIFPSGRIYEGHGVDRQGAHTGGRNNIARAIALVGDYSGRGPTQEQRVAVAWLLQEGYNRRWWSRKTLNGGHRNAPGASTACPGDQAYAAITGINHLALGAPIKEGTSMTPNDWLMFPTTHDYGSVQNAKAHGLATGTKETHPFAVWFTVACIRLGLGLDELRKQTLEAQKQTALLSEIRNALLNKEQTP